MLQENKGLVISDTFKKVLINFDKGNTGEKNEA